LTIFHSIWICNEIRVIIGPNGAGKTTVLDLICGRTKATSGSVMFKGLELTRMKEHEIVRAGVGRKFQTPSIYEDLTVFENLEISFPRGRSVFGALVFRRDAEVAIASRKSPGCIFLADHLDDLAEYLSHGQKQWLEIGMLLIQDPALMMLDEPVAGMSVSERTQENRRAVAQGHPAPVGPGDRARHGLRWRHRPSR
jgi:urea transport system ATP-binding protein